MFKIGLTGSIGTGKSTTAKMFAVEGCAVWDADAAVHRLYAVGGAAVVPMGERFPKAIENGAVSRNALKHIIQNDPASLKEIEQIVHPLVALDRQSFTERATADILVFDIPLLFETGGHTAFDAVVSVYVDPDTQRDRVLARGSMTEAQLDLILSKQIPAQEKADRADFVVNTDTMETARNQVREIVREIRENLENA